MLYGSSYNNMFLQTHKKKKTSSGHARSTRVEGAIKQYYNFFSRGFGVGRPDSIVRDYVHILL